MNNGFTFQNFIDKEITNVNLKKKVLKENRLNLASNELKHSKLDRINKELIQNINMNEINYYTYYPDEIHYFAEQLHCPDKNIALFAGSDDAIKIIMSSIGKFCGSMTIQTPNYENYYSYAQLNRIQIHKWKICGNLYFSLEEGMELLVQHSPSIVVIANPNGFTGISMTVEELDTLLMYCRKYGHMLVIDCVYSKFDLINYRELLDKYQNLILVNSLSKSYGLAGGRFGYIMGAEELITFISYWNGINAISSLTHATAKFYLKKQEEFEQIREDIISGRSDFITFINSNTPWNAIQSNANFVLVEMTSKEEADCLYNYLYNLNIIVRDLSINKYFGKHIRVTVADKPIMEQIKQYITKFIGKKWNYIKND